MFDVFRSTGEVNTREQSPRFAYLIVVLLTVITLAWSVTYPLRDILSLRRGVRLEDIAQDVLIEQTGVRVVKVGIIAGGGMIDLRFQVVDPGKAAIVHDPRYPIMIVDEASGKELTRQWMDHSHNRELHAAIIYPNLIMNLGGILKPGMLVTIRIGGVSLEHVILE